MKFSSDFRIAIPSTMSDKYLTCSRADTTQGSRHLLKTFAGYQLLRDVRDTVYGGTIDLKPRKLVNWDRGDLPPSMMVDR